VAKKSKTVKNERRRAMVARYAQRRAELKDSSARRRAPVSNGKRHKGSWRASQAMPARWLRNRDAVDGRPRGYLRKFGVSRVRVRQLAHNGQLPGVRKASW
jgi:small subunit ribosomal protein S14